MKFTCEKLLLLNAVNSAIKAVSTKNSLKALECILITADTNILVSGYDLNIGIKSSFDAYILNKGSCLIDANLLSNILKKLPDEELSFTVEENFKVKITCGKSVFDLISIDPLEFPEIPSAKKEDHFSIESKIFKDIIMQTKFARSDNESKLIHTGFLFDIDNDKLTLVAVDGYRMAVRRENIINNNSVKNTSFVVPGNALIELEKLLPYDESLVSIYLDTKHILFESRQDTLSTRLLEGEFLNYQASIPKDFKYQINCNVPSLKKSTDRVSLMISEKLKNPIRFHFDKNILKLSCITAIGKSYDEYIFDGAIDDLEIGFNNRYILDSLNACPYDDAVFSFNNSLSPLIITPCDEENDKFLYLILPVRLKNE